METATTHEHPWRRRYARYMFVVGIGGNLLFYLQAWEILTTQQARDVSLPAFLVGLWAVSSWFVYGLMQRDRVIIAANAVAIIGCGLVILGKLIYG
jgi:MtN3 and saliva related transmembrane protein